ncbi:GGDEF domain-containing protein [Arsukibacterium indicum]|uniref:diguanylate cyclase n=1 Tax=Arsukibacterium indicum TaxID=2848612 RepID=A0ABS6ML66_9GAMM|nr:GGDEF domain-containing protein [Arsukibacterium indicum]MBV2129109.1 GGDEF domain-containing protein [Arsukibacterium indicum]
MDILTLTIVNLFIAGGAGALFWLLYLADKSQQHLLYWAIAASCMLVSSTLSTLFHFGLSLPYWLTPALGNTLIVSLHLTLLAGLYQYFRLSVKLRWFVSVIIIVFAMHFSDFAQQATANRLFLNFPLIIIINFFGLHLLFRQRHTALNGIYLVLKLAFVLNITQMSLRFLLLLSDKWQLGLFSNPDFIHNIGFFGLTSFALLIFGSSILLVYRQQQLTLQQYSERDALTGLLNRRVMEQKISAELDRCHRQARPCSLVIFDLDHFKQVNDAHGHLAGDAALCHVAAITSAQLRSYDLFFRYGGEEFVVCLPDTDATAAKHVANRIRRAIESSVPVHYPELKLTISAGLASTRHNTNLQELLLQADQALYQAKNTGRNQICSFATLATPGH